MMDISCWLCGQGAGGRQCFVDGRYWALFPVLELSILGARIRVCPTCLPRWFRGRQWRDVYDGRGTSAWVAYCLDLHLREVTCKLRTAPLDEALMCLAGFISNASWPRPGRRLAVNREALVPLAQELEDFWANTQPQDRSYRFLSLRCLQCNGLAVRTVPDDRSSLVSLIESVGAVHYAVRRAGDELLCLTMQTGIYHQLTGALSGTAGSRVEWPSDYRQLWRNWYEDNQHDLRWGSEPPESLGWRLSSVQQAISGIKAVEDVTRIIDAARGANDVLARNIIAFLHALTSCHQQSCLRRLHGVTPSNLRLAPDIDGILQWWNSVKAGCVLVRRDQRVGLGHTVAEQSMHVGPICEECVRGGWKAKSGDMNRI